MKWIGQHIWDFISRFRSDVYLEATETGTIASGGNLGLDSNNKIVKASAGDALSFDGSTANGVLTYKDADEISVESSWTFDGTNQSMNIVSSTAQAPSIRLENSEGGITDPYILFKRTGSSPADGDNIGSLLFTSDNSNDESINFARIVTKISEVTDTDEAGKMELQVACSDGNNTSGSPLVTGLMLEGEHNTAGEIDVTIGAGASSTTTIAGGLVTTGTITTGSTAFVNNSGVIQVASQQNIDHDSLQNFVANEHIDWTASSAGTIHASNYSDTAGWHGSATRIKILHSDFIGDDGGRPLMIDDTGVASEELFLESFSAFTAYATVAIPTGYTATHVMIYGDGARAVEVWEHQINSKTGVSKGTGNVDTEINITDVASSATNYLFIQVVQQSGDEIHGGYVTITAS